MKKIIVNYWALLIWLITFVLDANYGILEKLIEDPFWVNIVRGVGTVALAYVTGKGAKTRKEIYNVSADDETDIGGGGIKNPKDGGQ